HFLESWGDAEPVSGCLGLRQPAIAPLFDTRAAQESLLRWMGRPMSAYDWLREHWRREVFPRQSRQASFDDFWDHSLQDGVCELPDEGKETAALDDRGDLDAAAAAILAACREAQAERGRGGTEVRLYEKVGLRDGRQANNPWLQEFPDPVSRIAWGNYACIAPRRAAELDLAEGDVVVLRRGRLAIELPVHLQPGQPPGSLSVALGYGRTHAGKVGDRVGANVFPLRPVRDGFVQAHATGVRLEKTGRREVLAAIQRHDSMEGRPIVRETALAEYRRDPAAGNEQERPEALTLWEERPREGHRWGMAIDLNACLGCGACVVACQAENNVPVVGRDEVA